MWCGSHRGKESNEIERNGWNRPTFLYGNLIYDQGCITNKWAKNKLTSQEMMLCLSGLCFLEKYISLLDILQKSQFQID